MPPPFTNVWDSTQPLDSDLVAAGAGDFRSFRTDVQQRMAAISGLDAQKPTFGSDAQPTQWAGVLFFALDTARIYQWNGAFWVDVTTSIGSGGGGGASGVVGRNTISITVSNSTTENTIFTTVLPALSPTAVLRIRTNFVVDTFAVPFNVMWRWNGGVITTITYSPGIGGEVMGTELFIANRTVTNNQQWNIYAMEGIAGSFTGGVSGEQVGETAIDTSVGTTLTFSVLDSAAGNTETLNLWLVELL